MKHYQDKYTDIGMTITSIYAKYNGIMTGIVCTIIICILYIVSYNLYIYNNGYSDEIINGTIINANCLDNKNEKGITTSYNCILDVSYYINNNKYTNKLITDNNTQLYINNIIKIKYNKINYNDIISDKIFNNKYIPFIICLCALLLCISIYIYIYFLFTNNDYAAGLGSMQMAHAILH